MVDRYLTVSASESEALTPFVRPAQYAPGEAIVPLGDVCRDIVLFAEGFVRAYYIFDDKEVNLRLLNGPSSALALESLITGEAAKEVIEAMSPIDGYVFRLLDYECAHPDGLGDKIRRIIAERHYLAMDRRLRMLQHKTAAERYAYFLEHAEPDVVHGVAGYHVASYLGVAPESLSRVRASLKKTEPVDAS